ncbi:peptide chain release factor 1 [Brachybacterium sp. EF45031]|uniref:peptide chain release factor 1 n=1 Tax=Brachybacterium sillae TaxID=2810536 RepID=UPI00217D7497|nr:peptide chain release factor 1 [Brachybacterium sillae]MCS6710923.1 peptide chain release factor 1 [Brachybacterium sillae]
MAGERLDALLREHAQLEREMADPAVHADAQRARRLGRRYAELSQISAAHAQWQRDEDDLAAARELGESDPELAAEAEELEHAAADSRRRLEDLLAPRDPDDARDVVLEVKAGAGGEEAALFAADLLRMYRGYAQHRGWSMESVSETPTELGGLKDATVVIRARGDVTPEQGVWASLKHEGGVHRVQRVPVTESQGRVHTSAAGVLVIPEADETDEDGLLAEEMAPANLRIDVFRSSGPGGQSVNTTDSAVRVTHLPTGIVVSSQNEKSQLQNREAALRVLRSRLRDRHREEAAAEASAQRRSQVRSLDRSERIRTYNFPESRVTDHRTGVKSHALEQVLGGDLDAFVLASRQAERAARLAEPEETS